MNTGENYCWYFFNKYCKSWMIVHDKKCKVSDRWSTTVDWKPTHYMHRFTPTFCRRGRWISWEHFFTWWDLDPSLCAQKQMGFNEMATFVNASSALYPRFVTRYFYMCLSYKTFDFNNAVIEANAQLRQQPKTFYEKGPGSY